MQPEIPVVELLRVSTADQAEEDRAGIPRQAEANRRTIARHGLRVVRQYRLEDVSGASILFAPEIADMLALLRSGQARGIVAADFDRLLRPDDFRSLAILQDLKESHALIYLPEQVIDLNTQSGFLLSGIHSVIAGNELAQIKARMMGAKEEKRRQGKHPGNHLNLPTGVGYDRKTERWFYTEEAEQVKVLFELFYFDGIHNYVELERRTGLQHRTIMNLLRNEIYIGYRHYKEKRAAERKVKPDGRRADKRKVARSQHEQIRVRVIDDPLIPEDVFWAVQDVIANRRHDHMARRRKGESVFLFQGQLRCGICGEPMYTVPGGKTGGPTKDYYYCRTRNSHFKGKPDTPACPSSYLRRTVVEDLVERFISERLADRDYILEHISRMYDESEARRIEVERAGLQRRMDDLEKKRGKLLDLYLKAVFTAEELDAKANGLNSEIQTLRNRLEAMNGREDRVTPEDLAEVASVVATAFALFPAWDEEFKRKFLELQRPEFYLTAEGVTKFMLPVCKNRNRTDMVAVLADVKREMRVEFEVSPTYEFVPRPTCQSLGLRQGRLYSLSETAALIGDRADSFRRRIMLGIYPGAAARGAGGVHRYTVEEVLEIARTKARISMGLPPQKSPGRRPTGAACYAIG